MRLWDPTKLTVDLILGHPAGAAGVAWSPNGKNLAVAGFSDGALRLWDASTGAFRLLTPIQGSWHRRGRLVSRWNYPCCVVADRFGATLAHAFGADTGVVSGTRVGGPLPGLVCQQQDPGIRQLRTAP